MDERTVEHRRREEFKAILFELAQDDQQSIPQQEDKRKSYYDRWAKIYQFGEFRHFYSDIYSVLTELNEDSSKGNIDILAQDLRLLRDNFVPYTDQYGHPIDIKAQLMKLEDHISLDVARLSYTENLVKKLDRQSSVRELDFSIKDLNTRVDQQMLRIRKEQETQLERLNDAQKDYIAILGIFSAVVLTFMGGIAFSTSVLENIHKASAYRLIVITLLIGLVLFNTLLGLFYCIRRLIFRGNDPKSDFSIRFALLVNVIFILILTATFALWRFGIIEQRNAEVQATVTTFSDSASYPSQ